MRVIESELFVYSLCPTDFFAGSITIEQFLAKDLHNCNESHLYRIFHFMRCMYETGKLIGAKKEYFWEGDIIQGIYVFAVPSGDLALDFGYIWKQSNNGNTFVISPVEIKKLSGELIGTFKL